MRKRAGAEREPRRGGVPSSCERRHVRSLCFVILQSLGRGGARLCSEVVAFELAAAVAMIYREVRGSDSLVQRRKLQKNRPL